MENSNFGYSDEDISNLVSPAKFSETIERIKQNAELATKSLNYLNYHLLDRAAYFNNFDLVRYLCENFPGEVNYRSENTCTDALKCAALKGNQEILEYLISKGADPRKKYDNDVFILYFAESEGHYDLAKYLIEKYKFDTSELIAENGMTSWSQPMIDYVEGEDNSKRNEFFLYCINKSQVKEIKNQGVYNYLGLAASINNPLYIRKLNELKAEYSEHQPYGWTPFSYAALENNEEHMKFILKNYDNVPPEEFNHPFMTLIVKEYNNLSYKYQRLKDVLMFRIYCERFREMKHEEFSKMKNSNKLEEIIKVINHFKANPHKSSIFRINRNVFLKVYRCLPLLNYSITVT